MSERADMPADLFAEAPVLPPIYLDRSTLERYTICPFRGWAVEAGHVQDTSPEAQTGQEVHRVIAEAIGQYATAGVPLREYLEIEIAKVRADVQPDAIEALQRSIWAIDRLVTGRHPNDVLAYQGGEGDRSGQLAVELLPATRTRGPIIITSEVDLLLAGTTAVEIEEIDFKSGHTPLTSTTVRDSFQFQMHAVLAFAKFPTLELLHTSVFLTREGWSTPAVTFTRKRAEQFKARLLQAVEHRRQMFAAAEAATAKIGAGFNPKGEPEAVKAWLLAFMEIPQQQKWLPCWPWKEKCELCPASHICPRAINPHWRLEEDPVKFTEDTNLLRMNLIQREESLRRYVTKHGDIEGPGVCYGLREPKPPEKPRATAYRFYDPPKSPAPPPPPDVGDELAKAFESKDASDD